METLAAEALALSATNVIGIRALRSYVGKFNHVAGLISCWRPFLTELWAAMAAWDKQESGTSKSPPPGTIWTKQIKHTLEWIQAFLDRKAGTLVRRIDCRVYWGGSNMVEVITDASPWGLGGVRTYHFGSWSFLAGVVRNRNNPHSQW